MLSGWTRLNELTGLTPQQVVASSVRVHELSDNGTSYRTDLDLAGRFITLSNGMKLPEALRQGHFDKPVPLHFDLPIIECPDGDCISPVSQPHEFNAPCTGDAHFRVASGLAQHPFFDEICQSK